MHIVLFEDDRTARLDPVATAKPAYSISCGSYRLIDLVEELGTVRGVVRKHLQAIEAARAPSPVSQGGTLEGEVLFVNARLTPSVKVIEQLKQFVNGKKEGSIIAGETIAAAYVNRKSLRIAFDGEALQIDDLIRSFTLPQVEADLPLIEYPHDLLRHHLACFRDNLEHRIQQGNFRQLRDGVFVADDVSLSEHFETDTTSGPILIERGTTIGPFCFLRGPVYVGPNCKLIEHSALKDGVALGHTAKVGGEVEASIIEPFTNKQHHGFIGHSYLGSWVNLGAGTSNSDLKNTYGPVNMEYRGRRVASGMQFVGCFIGDFAKTAVNTSIFTGKIIGVCSMVYGFVTTNVPSFCNYARSFGQVTELPPEVMIATQQRMFARRKVEQRPCDVQLIHDMYELTRPERQLAGEPLTL